MREQLSSGRFDSMSATKTGSILCRVKPKNIKICNSVFVICNSAQLRKKEFQKISNLLEKNGFSLNYISRQIQHFLAKKQSKKPKTDKKDDTKRIFMKLPYIKEMNGHIPKEINGFLKKLDSKVTFYFNQRNVQFKASFYLQRAPR